MVGAVQAECRGLKYKRLKKATLDLFGKPVIESEVESAWSLGV